ncbi:MAG: YIP1 family protein [Rhodobacteraceae bacterium]|nr:YIP1 family protein [Paracoccaceae bacterium]NCX19594.1 YIP1 family protein [Paracoccaceae bacterium]NDD43130.1 YIP1 family protein [Paracoccaceae bacterium]NDD89673.1 YIP1 family protein [Paracoccaceae bacterium]NDI03066.1 YIP1 family protein [Paracoccaceae bacterium]
MIDLTRLTLDTPRDPKSVAEHLLGLGLLRPQIISLFAVSVCLSVISLFVSNVSMNGDNPFVIIVGPGLVMGPLPVAIMIFVMTLVSALASSRIGRMFGGQGDFNALLIVMSWLQWMQFVFQMLSTLLSFVSIALSGLASLVIFVLTLWIFVAMVDRAHGFESALKSIVTIVLGSAVAGVSVGFVAIMFAGAM